ncbi:hypothetical protein [Sporosarcina trichiuri]|uniref:hypothetical protein n=1 Tax=Sporosarcina trichiuri TaxID=3056445 RepID=UPI0025B463F8|nr:hypothetical protein [Sporosarcina sp. 0.2-SM1T-5]WJY27855.1 hypothetical protein QWT68_02425 [Sporosarcina sp. 0.2-SM1T-5]
MKKFLLLGAMGVLLAGCSDNQDTEEPDTADDQTSSLEENSVNTPPDSEADAEQQASEAAEMEGTDGDSDQADESGEAETSVDDPALADFEEYSTVKETADIDGLKGIVETDNPGTRVILYEDENGEKKVKSIFVKKENWLKVISLVDDGMLYNDILK